MDWVLSDVTGCRNGKQKEGKQSAQGRQDRQKYSKVPDPLSHEGRQGRSEDEEDWNDCVDDGDLLHRDAEGLHVQVQVRVEDGHGGRLEEEDELDPNLLKQELI